MVDAVTVMHLLWFVLHVWMLRDCDGDGNDGVGDGGVVVVNAGHVGGICGSGIVSGAADVLGISVVRGMRAVGGFYNMRMCLARAA